MSDSNDFGALGTTPPAAPEEPATTEQAVSEPIVEAPAEPATEESVLAEAPEEATSEESAPEETPADDSDVTGEATFTEDAPDNVETQADGGL